MYKDTPIQMYISPKTHQKILGPHYETHQEIVGSFRNLSNGEIFSEIHYHFNCHFCPFHQMPHWEMGERQSLILGLLGEVVCLCINKKCKNYNKWLKYSDHNIQRSSFLERNLMKHSNWWWNRFFKTSKSIHNFIINDFLWKLSNWKTTRLIIRRILNLLHDNQWHSSFGYLKC